jgi:hypothetical protein
MRAFLSAADNRSKNVSTIAVPFPRSTAKRSAFLSMPPAVLAAYWASSAAATRSNRLQRARSFLHVASWRFMGAILFSFAAVSTFAADLNAPGDKPVTIGSEIQRGASAVSALDTGARPGDLFSAYVHLLDKNKQANTDTKGFVLGSKAEFVMQMHIIFVILKKSIEDGHTEGLELMTTEIVNNLLDVTEREYREFRAGQKELAVSDAQVIELIGVTEKGFRENLAIWEKTAGEKPQAAAPDPVPAKARMTVQEATKRALEAWPELGVANSPLNLRYVDRVKAYRESKPAYFENPEWPWKLAQEIAGE